MAAASGCGRDVTRAEIDEKVRELAGVFERLSDLVGAAGTLAAPSAPADAQSLTTVPTEVTALIPYAPRSTLPCILKMPQDTVCDS